VTDATTDAELLASQAAALPGVMRTPARSTVLKPVEAKSELGAPLSTLPDDSIFWKQAADDLHQAYQKPADLIDGSFRRAEWWLL
jgi:hypothetical protein